MGRFYGLILPMVYLKDFLQIQDGKGCWSKTKLTRDISGGLDPFAYLLDIWDIFPKD